MFAGWSIRSYKDKDPVPLYTNKVTSPITELPFAYAQLPFACPTAKSGYGSKFGPRNIGLNLGEVLRGDRISVSDYELVVGEDQPCKHLCDRRIAAPDVDRTRRLVREGYAVEWFGDLFW